MTRSLMIFDLDGTLAESKSALDPEMAGLLRALLGVVQVAIISGGDWPQFEAQVLGKLPADAALDRLVLLPTCGTKFFRYDGTWTKLYSEDFTADERRRTVAALEEGIEQSGFKPERTWGELIEDRGTQITYSALGQQAPLDAKKAWDPDFAKRKRFKQILDPMIPDLSVCLGGATSVDVTKPGIDKAYGVRKLVQILGIPIEQMLFVGDALFPGGNDAPVRGAGVLSIQVRDPDESKRVIETFIACVS
jgi:phosphomannomutase